MTAVDGTHHIAGAGAMHDFGGRIGADLRRGDVVLLHGDLGAGKTTLTQGIAAELGISEPVQSPTFTLMSEYQATLPDGTRAMLWHLDLYRLDDPEELEDIGWEEAVAPEGGVTIVEWPERAGDWLPSCFLLVRIEHAGPEARQVRVERIGAAQQEP